MELRKRLIDLGSSALVAALLSFSLTGMLLTSVVSDWPWPMAALMCAAVALVCAFAAVNKITALITAGCIGAGVAAMFIWHVSPVSALTHAGASVAAFMGGDVVDLHGDLVAITALLALLFGVACMLMVRMGGGVYPAVLLTGFVLLGSWYLSHAIPYMPLIPGLVALAVLYARSFRAGSVFIKALPAALMAALIAVLIMPKEPLVYEPLQDLADRVRELVNDYFMFDDPRVIYSVSADGYQPRVDMLGGQATPRQEDVMLVRTDTSLLLRGAVSRNYTGLNWTDDSVNSRYLFIDPTRLSRRSRAFDVDKINALRDVTHLVDVNVTFVSEGTSTLFVPHRVTSLSTAVDMPAYYNETGEVFITRAVQPGDSYALQAYVIDADAVGLAEAVKAAENARDGNYAAIAAEYMSLPGGVESELYYLVMELTRGLTSPVDKAMAIQAYLTGGEFRYTLNGSYAPSGRDFVSWFVLSEKQGYCTYFASAMAVMARLSGIPSRYVEGYRVFNDGSGEVLVTGEDAHAWAELYFNGIGWVPFDATPGEGGQNPEGGQSPNDDQQPDANEGGESDDGGQDGGSETEGDGNLPPEPTPTPEVGGGEAPTPTPLPDEGSDQPDQSGDSPQDEPEQQPDDAPTDPPADEPNEQNQRKRSHAWLIVLLILLLLVAMAYLLRRRLMLTDPAHMADAQPDNREKMLVWYRATLTLLARRGIAPEGGESPDMFAQRVTQEGSAPQDFARLGRAVSAVQYSGRKPAEQTVLLARNVYEAMLTTLTRREKTAWTLHRMRWGIGDVKQIP